MIQFFLYLFLLLFFFKQNSRMNGAASIITSVFILRMEKQTNIQSNPMAMSIESILHYALWLRQRFNEQTIIFLLLICFACVNDVAAVA